MSGEKPIVGELREAAEALRAAGVSEPVKQARDLLQIALGKDAAFIIAHPEHLLSDSQSAAYRGLVSRRASREPFQHIAGRQDFFGLEFKVTPDVMIPRPETELIVEMGIDLLKDVDSPSICEVGTGSGCIVVSLLHGLPDSRAVGLEKSPRAMEMTRLNAESNGVFERLDLRSSDVFGDLIDTEKFDLIVSNPPYVPSEDVASLQPEVRDHEPLISLTDGADGLSIIFRIVREAPLYLRKGGHLLLEIGFSQSPKVLSMFDDHIWSDAEAFPDLQGIPRMIKASISVS